ncbi:MAG: DUF2807 domain-containing protein [candidate division Zixibacteria bacterium]|nr:DUF2807 domain-containing protein [candidate division Zixibacteria bacterium]
MYKYSVKAILILTIVLLFGCQSLLADGFLNRLFLDRGIEGSGDLITEERDVREFNEIKTSGSFDIFVEVGPERSLKITFDDNLIDIIETEVRGKTLRIGSEESFSSHHVCKVEITVPELEAVSLSGSGNVEVINLKGDVFESSISGSGNVKVTGEVREVELEISGSGEIEAEDLIADDAYVKISGSGDVRVYARESLEGRVSGSGSIYYSGNPQSLSTNVSGSGRIKKVR